LGRFSVPISKISAKIPEVPTWYPIYAKDPKYPEGEILASFQLYEFFESTQSFLEFQLLNWKSINCPHPSNQVSR
jgi:hypothetical protein